MKIILSSGNPGKAREVRAALAEMNVELLLPAEAGFDFQVEETGSTYAENALIKARVACEASGLPALADDSGVEIDALPGELGVREAGAERFGAQ